MKQRELQQRENRMFRQQGTEGNDTSVIPNSMRNAALWRPEFEHDACGTGFIAHVNGKKSHAIIEDALEILKRLAHRGGTGSDPDTGDGAGVLVQIPDRFFRERPGSNCRRKGSMPSVCSFYRWKKKNASQRKR